MAIPVNTLMEEAKCYLCLGISQAEAMELALLNRIASGGSDGGALVWRGNLTQTGVNAPVATVFENDLGGDIVWSYLGVGQYQGLLANAFPTGRTWMIIDSAATSSGPGNDVWARAYFDINPSVIHVDVVGAAGGDDELSNTALEIRVFP